MKSSLAVLGETPPDVVTRTSATPRVIVAGDVTVILVELTTVTPVPAFALNATVAPLMKFVPVMVTAVPPVEGPVFVLRDVTAGATAV